MKVLLLLSVGLGLTWALQDQTNVPVAPYFVPEQVMLRGLRLRQGVSPRIQLLFQVPITLQSLDSNSQ